MGEEKKKGKTVAERERRDCREEEEEEERELTAEGTVDPVKRSEEAERRRRGSANPNCNGCEGEFGREREEQEKARELEKRGELVSGTLLVTACLQLCPPNLPLRG